MPLGQQQDPFGSVLSGSEQSPQQAPAVPQAPTFANPFDPFGSVAGDVDTPRSRLSSLGSPEPTGAAFRALEHLRAPQSALFSAIIAGTDPELTFGQVFGKRPSFNDVLNAGGVPEFAGRGLVEFAGDVIFDPINIVPVTGLGRGLLRVGGKMGMGGVKALDRIGVPGIEAAQQGLTRAFRGALTQEGRAARRIATQAGREQRFAAGDIGKLLVERDQQIGKFARELGIPKSELDRAISARVEAGVRHENFNVSETILDSLGAGGEPIFDLKGLSDVAKWGGRFDPRGPSVIAMGFDPKKIAPLTKAGEDLVRPMVDEFKENAIKQIQLEKMGGIKPKVLDSARLDYLMHAIHPETQKVLLQNPAFRAVGRSWNPQHASLLAREIRDVSIAEINALSMQGRLAMTKFQKIPLFIDNPAVLDALRAFRGARAIASAKLLEDISAKFGLQITKKAATRAVAAQELGLPAAATLNEVREAAIKKGLRPVAGDRLPNVWMEGEVADVIDTYFDIAKNPDLLQKFARHAMNVQNNWKAWTLAVFPEYHTRNVVGNMWNNWLAGLNNPTWYAKANALQTLATKGKIAPTMVRRLTNAAEDAIPSVANQQFKVGSVTQSAQSWIDEMAGGGVLRGGIFGAELETTGRQLASPATGSSTRRFFRGDNRGVRKGFEIGQHLEDNARVAHYLWKRSTGATAEEAADSVQKFLFNYDELDPFTQAARKVMPFLTWSRFNLPLQLEHLIVDPTKAAAINKFRIGVEGADLTSFGPLGEAIGIPGFGGAKEGPDERFISDWVRENMGIRTRRSGRNDYDFFTLENWIPLADLSEVGLPQLEEGIGAFAEQAGEFAVGLLTPLLTVPVETVTGQSLFLERPFLPERREFFGVDMPERLSNVLRTMRVLSVIDRFIVAPKGTTLGSNIIRTLTGIRVTPHDSQRGRAAFFGEIGQRERDLSAAHRRAIDNGRLKEADRLWDELMEVKRERNTRR